MKRKIATTFGGSEFELGSEQYIDAILLGELLAEMNFIVKNGGYYGLMEGVAKGVFNKKGEIIGITNAAFGSKSPNIFITRERKKKDIFSRTREMIQDSTIIIVQEGSIGTLFELFAIWDLLYTQTLRDIPIYLIGKTWKEKIESLKHWFIKDHLFDYLTIFDNFNAFKKYFLTDMKFDSGNDMNLY